MSKSYKISLVIFIVLGLFFGIFMAMQNSSIPRSGLSNISNPITFDVNATSTQNYINIPRGYELKYPPVLRVNDSNAENVVFSSSDAQNNLSVEIFDDSAGLSIADWWKKFQGSNASNFTLVGTKNIPAWYTGQLYRGESGSNENHFVFIKSGSIYDIHGDIGDDAFNKIIDTFNFPLGYSYPSLDGNYFLKLYFDLVSNNCRYRVIGSNNSLISINNIVDSDITSCGDNGDTFWYYFGGWGDGNKLLLPGNAGNISIIDVKALSSKIYKYDAKLYRFNGVDRSLKHWLFRKIGGGGYVLLDESGNMTLSHLPYTTALYDRVNDGFVLTNESSNSSGISTQMDFLPSESLSIRHVAITQPIRPPEHDCPEPSLSSKPGEIILQNGCLGNIDIKI